MTVARYSWGGRNVKLDLTKVHAEIKQWNGYGWTYFDLAKWAGVSPRTFGRFITARRVSARTVHRILSALKIDADEVLTYSEKP